MPLKQVYTIIYEDDTKFTDYDIDALINKSNQYNEQNNIKHRLTKPKLYIYAKQSPAKPKCYKSVSVQRLNDVLGIENLRFVDIRKKFDELQNN